MTTDVSPARSFIPPAEALDYIDGVAGAGLTARRNITAWQALSLLPHVLTDVRTIDPTIALLGRTLPTPIIAAPWAAQGYIHPDGELITARAAHDTGVTLGLSSGSSKSIESVAALSGPFVQQIYLPNRRELLEAFLTRVVASGAFALALTVDNPHTPVQHSFRSNLSALPSGPSENFPEIEDRRQLSSSANLTPDDIRWLHETTGLPIMVKGLLRADDARRAVDAGAAGIIVSNHAGRQLDGVAATATALPAITTAVGGTVPVLVDGGIRTGADIVKALALGATAVLIGHPIARAVAHNGYHGVHTLLAELVDDLTYTLAMVGVPRAVDLTRDLIA